jgi:ABC-type amino acid transport substrate-binding protein
MLGIADAIFGDQDIISGTAHTYFPDLRINISTPMTTAETWLGGSPDMDDATAARLQAAMKAVVKDGTYARLLKDYGLRAGR